MVVAFGVRRFHAAFVFSAVLKKPKRRESAALQISNLSGVKAPHSKLVFPAHSAIFAQSSSSACRATELKR
jgi:hypothetical protein